MFGYQCEYCDGTVESRRMDREAFKHKQGFVILEGVTIGICGKCGNRYYTADVLRAVHDVATGKRPPDGTTEVPVAHMG